MSNNEQRNVRPGWLAWSAVVVAMVLLSGNVPYLSTTAQGDIRETTVPPTFLSGGERSEAVLKAMAETLTRIDLRLERFEKALRETETTANRPAAPMGTEAEVAAGQ